MVKVLLLFEGGVEVDIDADPEDDEAWAEAISNAWALVPDEEIATEAIVTGHEIGDDDDEED